MNHPTSIHKERLLAKFSGQLDQPYFICIAGIHGNENAGVQAVEQIIEKLNSSNLELYGSFIAIKGNLKALNLQQRFIDNDLNRMLYPEMIDFVQSRSASEFEIHEQHELKNILDLIKPYLELARQGKTVYLLDLHTTSAYGGLFTISSNTTKGIEVGKRVGVPVIIGIDQVIRGTTVNFCEQNNLTGFAFEGGQHNDPTSVRNIEAAIWMFLEATEILSKIDIEQYEAYQEIMDRYGALYPKVVQFKFRHHVKPDDDFIMNPNMKNFMQIDKDQIVAKDKHGYIKAPMSGMLLMPLYQKQGDDGFFITEEKSEINSH